MQEHLWRHGLKFDLREIRGHGAYVERGIFTIQNEVVVTITIAADIDEDEIRLTVRNLERLGEYTYVYDYDEFTPELHEELGKALLSQPNRLRAFGRRQSEGVEKLV